MMNTSETGQWTLYNGKRMGKDKDDDEDIMMIRDKKML